MRAHHPSARPALPYMTGTQRVDVVCRATRMNARNAKPKIQLTLGPCVLPGRRSLPAAAVHSRSSFAARRCCGSAGGFRWAVRAAAALRSGFVRPPLGTAPPRAAPCRQHAYPLEIAYRVLWCLGGSQESVYRARAHSSLQWLVSVRFIGRLWSGCAPAHLMCMPACPGRCSLHSVAHFYLKSFRQQICSDFRCPSLSPCCVPQVVVMCDDRANFESKKPCRASENACS